MSPPKKMMRQDHIKEKAAQFSDSLQKVGDPETRVELHGKVELLCSIVVDAEIDKERLIAEKQRLEDEK